MGYTRWNEEQAVITQFVSRGGKGRKWEEMRCLYLFGLLCEISQTKEKKMVRGEIMSHGG